MELSIGLLLTSGVIAEHIGHFMTITPLLESFPKSALFINLLISWLIITVYSVIIFTLPFVLILVWMNNIEEYIDPNNLHENEVILWAEKNIELYR